MENKPEPEQFFSSDDEADTMHPAMGVTNKELYKMMLKKWHKNKVVKCTCPSLTWNDDIECYTCIDCNEK